MKCWIPIDGTYAIGEGPRMSPEQQEIGYPHGALHHLRQLPGNLPAR